MNTYTSTTDSTTPPDWIKDVQISFPNPNRESYERDLARRRQEHLDSIQRQNDINWSPCMHDNCPECVGTGIKRGGGSCVHMISCPCPKCTPRF